MSTAAVQRIAHRAPAARRRAGLMLTVLLWGCTQGSPEGRPSKGTTDDGQQASSVFFLLVDPTLYAPEQRELLASNLDELKRLFSNLPENSRVVVRLIQRQATYATPLAESHFSFDPSFAGAETHRRRLEREFNEVVRPRLERAWEDAHAPEGVTTLSSCLVTALFVVGRELEAHSCSDQGVRCHLVVVSDMMEACNEWGRAVNLEKGPQGLDALRTLLPEIDLAALCSITVVQLGNPRVVLPREQAAIEDFWKGFLGKCSGGDGGLRYLARFPPDFDFSCPVIHGK